MAAFVKLRVTGAERLRRGQDYMWSVIREYHATGQPFSVLDIWKRTAEPQRSTVSAFVIRLEKAGFVKRAGERKGLSGHAEKLFLVAQSQTAAPVVGKNGGASRYGQGRQNMWNVMRRERDGFTALELAALATTDDVPCAVQTAFNYCKRLEHVGILGVAMPGGKGTPRRWWLKGSGNSGPKPPMIMNGTIVFDQNLSSVVGEVIAEEDPS